MTLSLPEVATAQYLRGEIIGNLEIAERVRTGSMGAVYTCIDRGTPGRKLALKVLSPQNAADKTARARFLNEILMVSELSHPNVVKGFGLVEESPLPAYLMEYVTGGDLADRLNGGPLDAAEIIEILKQLCAGVQAIHDLGIVHRDLKPENILLTGDGRVKISDFGIARQTNGPRHTEPGGVVGTLDYVSPEYLMRTVVDWRSDIYALGVMAYEMVTGKIPFRASSVYSSIRARMESDPLPPSRFSPCPKRLEAIILKALARDPEARFQSAEEMRAALNAITAADLNDLQNAEECATRIYIDNRELQHGSCYQDVVSISDLYEEQRHYACNDDDLCTAKTSEHVASMLEGHGLYREGASPGARARIKFPIEAVMYSLAVSFGIVVGWVLWS